jgi:hypothetical protein
MTPPKMYGIWQPGLGWVKAYKKGGMQDAYATYDIDVARDVARRVGGKVKFIDDALAMMEDQLLKAEAQPKFWEKWIPRKAEK